jgi:hypothetical protein
MSKPAPVDYPITAILREHWSTVSFSEEAVAPDTQASEG